MQALRLLPPDFLLPAWGHGQLTQLRWLHDLSGHLNPPEAGSKHGENNSRNPLFRKLYNIDSASALGFYKTRSTADSTKLILPNRESAFLEAQIEGDVHQKDTAYAPGQSNAETRYSRRTAQHDGKEAASAYMPNKQQLNNGSRAKSSWYHLRVGNAPSPPLSRATNSNRGNQSGRSMAPSSMAHSRSQPHTVEIVPSSQQEHNMGQNSDIIRGYKKDQTEGDHRPWAWMSLPSYSKKSRQDHKKHQHASVDLPSQPQFAADPSVEWQSTTSVFGHSFPRSDMQLLRTTGEEVSLGETETDRVTLPVRQPVENGICSHRENTLHSASAIAQSRSAKSRNKAGGNQRPPQGRFRLRDKTNLEVLPAAKEVIHKPVQRELSLLEQLFPEEAKTHSKASGHGHKLQEELARLPPPEFDELHESLNDDSAYIQLSAKLKTREATVNAFRQENTTILLLTRVSTALCDADFRRIVPRGIHIEEWRGPGDILKVIPSRDMSSLSPTSSYYLLFSNPAYARAYQNQVIDLHRMAQTYTPTSLDFPMPPLPGVLDTKGQDVHALLQDFTISPPSARMSLRVLIPPYHANLQRLLENEGYPQLVQPENKAGRAVLFWVDGHQPSALSLRTMLSKDGRDRGLQWGPLRGHGEIEVLQVHAEHNGGEIGEGDTADPGDRNDRSEWRDTELKPKRHGHQRWIISFEDEVEARRFVRVWHRRPYPFPLQEETPSYGEPYPLVHAEYMW